MFKGCLNPGFNHPTFDHVFWPAEYTSDRILLVPCILLLRMFAVLLPKAESECNFNGERERRDGLRTAFPPNFLPSSSSSFLGSVSTLPPYKYSTQLRCVD